MQPNYEQLSDHQVKQTSKPLDVCGFQKATRHRDGVQLLSLEEKRLWKWALKFLPVEEDSHSKQHDRK